MDNLEKQLNRLPKARLRVGADASLRLKLHLVIWRERLEGFRVWLSPSPRLAVAFLVLIFLFTTLSVPVYAYTSNSVTSEHFLYPVKQTVEKIELGLSLSPESKAETLVKISNHRLDEAVVLSNKKNSEALQKSLNEVVSLNQKAQDELLNAKKDLGVKIDEIIEESKEEQIKKLEKVAVNIGVEAEDDAIENVALTMDFVKSYSKNKKERPEYRKENFNTFPESDNKKEDGSIATTSEDEKQEALNEKNDKDNKNDESLKKMAEKISPTRQDKKDLENDLEEMKKGVETLKNDLKKEDLKESDVKIMVEKLDNRVEKVEKMIEEEELDDADAVLKSTQAIKNNAKSFIKMKSKTINNQKKDDNKNESNSKNENNNSTRSKGWGKKK